MCGIVGYVGEKECTPILIEGLRRLEYRGYDSAGVAVLDPATEGLTISRVVRCRGKLANLENLLRDSKPVGRIGIGHTRWATHGRPSDENAHPHKSGARQRRAQRHHREPPGAARRAARQGAHLLVGDRHRDHRPPRRRGAQGRRQGDLARGGAARAQAGAGRLRHRRHGRHRARSDRRRQERLAAGARARRRRELHRLGRAGDPDRTRAR